MPQPPGLSSIGDKNQQHILRLVLTHDVLHLDVLSVREERSADELHVEPDLRQLLLAMLALVAADCQEVEAQLAAA